MSIELQCSECSKTLRVADEHAGKQARCPQCNAITIVPEKPESDSATTADNSDPFGQFAGNTPSVPESFPTPGAFSTERPEWYMKTPEGKIFGPEAKTELDKWYQEGRINADCEIRRTEVEAWQIAGAYYPALAPGQPAPQAAYAAPQAQFTASGGHQQAGFNPPPPGSANPYAQDTPYAASPMQGRSYAKPHRGGLILTLGILAWVVTPFFGIAAWIMGNSDIHDMERGVMDPSGMGLTQAGRILGMVICILMIAAICIGLMFVLLFVVGAAVAG